MAEKTEVLKESSKKDSKENKFIRSAQSVGKTTITGKKGRREFEIIKDSRHLEKGRKVKLCRPTEELFRAKGLIK